MLVLSRKLGERIVIGEEIILTVIEVRRDRIRLGVSAPPAVPIDREEVFQRLQKQHYQEANEMSDHEALILKCA
jgi:carbon storage regulator